MRKTTKKKIAPIAVTVLVLLYVGPLVVTVLVAAAGLLEEGFSLIPFLLGYALIGGAVVVGVISALIQRLDEIDRGEEEEASRY